MPNLTQQIVVADNNFIRNNILSNVMLLESLPALRTLKAEIEKLTAACGTCGGGADAQRKLDNKWNDLRQFLVNLPEDKKASIRNSIAGGKRLRISYRTGTGANTSYPAGFV